jgi:hypothetical protein
MTSMIIPATLLLATGGQEAPPPLVANGERAVAEILHVGKTGIMCARRPCPHRGVFTPKSAPMEQPDLLYSDLDGKTPPPPMVGDEAARQQISEAWADHTCLAIEGRLISGEDDRPILRVDRVIGPCGDQPK